MNKFILGILVSLPSLVLAERYSEFLPDSAEKFESVYVKDPALISVVTSVIPDACIVNQIYGPPVLSDGTMLLSGNCNEQYANIVIPKTVGNILSPGSEKATIHPLAKGHDVGDGWELVAITSSSVPYYQHNYQTYSEQLFTGGFSMDMDFAFVSPQAISLQPAASQNSTPKLFLGESEQSMEQLPVYFLKINSNNYQKIKNHFDPSEIVNISNSSEITKAFILLQNSAWEQAIASQKENIKTVDEFYRLAPSIITTILLRKIDKTIAEYAFVLNTNIPSQSINSYVYVANSTDGNLSSKALTEEQSVTITGLMLNPLMARERHDDN